MLRFFLALIIVGLSVISASAATPKISQKEMANDLKSLIVSRENIDQLVWTGLTYTAFTRRYLDDLDTFSQKYINSFQALTLRPTIDRSLGYHFHIQEYKLSCEISALQIVLSALKIGVTESDIITSLPYYPYIYASGGIWWDPDNQFVGFYTGSQSKQTGYGIYESPLANYAKIYKLKTEIINQNTYSGTMNPWVHMKTLLGYLKQKNTHIILWWDWCTDPQYEDGVLSIWGKWMSALFPLPARNYCKNIAMNRILNWKTPEWKNIRGLSGEHAFILLGYIGTIDKPSHIIVWDTYTGRHIYTYSEWMRKWSLMEYRSLIIFSR